MTSHRIFFVERQSLPPHVLPKRKTSLSAGVDLYNTTFQEIEPQGRVLIPCGWEIILPPNHYGRIADISSFSLKTGVHVIAGVVDNDYEGELGVLLSNPTRKSVIIEPYTRIAQLIITPYCDYRPALITTVIRKQINLLSDRSDSGFGVASTSQVFGELGNNSHLSSIHKKNETWCGCQGTGWTTPAPSTIQSTNEANRASEEPITEEYATPAL
jgi:deoxyuridine 5'-triphosphate nucleotidohydrolase